MARSELFLLLPVYEEVTGQPDYISRIGIIGNVELNKYIEMIMEFGEFFAIENYTGYYDTDNIKAFLYPVEIMEDCYPKAVTRFRSVMSKWGESWRQEKKQDNKSNYMYLGKQIQDCTLCEIAERKCVLSADSTFLLVSCGDALSCKGDTASVQRQGKEVEVDVRKLEIKELASWFEKKRRPSRIFNWNPKHGEYGKGAHPENKGDKVSVLMGSREEASVLLHKAIGIDPKILFFLDEAHNQYIEFKRETENTYHAFHLDVEDEKRVPAIVKQRIEKLR